MELDVLSLITVQVLKIDIKKCKSNIGMDCEKWLKQIHVCPLNVLLLMNHLLYHPYINGQI